MFCSWGAEEYGLIGSMEYVEVGGAVVKAVTEVSKYLCIITFHGQPLVSPDLFNFCI